MTQPPSSDDLVQQKEMLAIEMFRRMINNGSWPNSLDGHVNTLAEMLARSVGINNIWQQNPVQATSSDEQMREELIRKIFDNDLAYRLSLKASKDQLEAWQAIAEHERALADKLAEALEKSQKELLLYKDDAFCDHQTGVCSCEYWRTVETNKAALAQHRAARGN